MRPAPQPPIGFKTTREVSLSGYVTALERRVAELERRVAVLEARPAAAPPEDRSLFGMIFGPWRGAQ